MSNPSEEPELKAGHPPAGEQENITSKTLKFCSQRRERFITPPV